MLQTSIASMSMHLHAEERPCTGNRPEPKSSVIIRTRIMYSRPGTELYERLSSPALETEAKGNVSLMGES